MSIYEDKLIKCGEVYFKENDYEMEDTADILCCSALMLIWSLCGLSLTLLYHRLGGPLSLLSDTASRAVGSPSGRSHGEMTELERNEPTT